MTWEFKKSLDRELDIRNAKLEEERQRQKRFETIFKNNNKLLARLAHQAGKSVEDYIGSQVALNEIAKQFGYTSANEYMEAMEAHAEENTHVWGGGMTKEQWEILNPEERKTSVKSKTTGRRINTSRWDPKFNPKNRG